MEQKPGFLHFLVIATAIISALLIAVGAVFEAQAPQETNEILSEGRPRIGKLEAKIEMVLIEDLRCSACHFFSEKIFPDIDKEYIQTGRAYCIVVPVSFLEGSEPLANAILAVYKLSPERFVDYWHAVFEHFNGREYNGREILELMDLAEEVGGIDLNLLRQYLETDHFSLQLKENIDWARRIMGRNFGTPALYINGLRTSTGSVEAVKARIDKLEMAK